MEQTASPSPVHKLQWFGWTDRGKVRKNNEDSYLGVRFDSREVQHLGRVGETSLSAMDLAFAVSDGMGGAKAGEYASRIAVEKITTLMPKTFRQSAAGLDSGFVDILTELFDRIHKALVYLGGSYEECHGMEATLSLCWFTPGKVVFGHIGDSRIYYLPASQGGMRQLSQDDTHVGWLLRNGQISEWEARNHPRRNVLQKSLGGGNLFVDPQVGAVLCEPGDTFLLCSDGLTEGMYGHRIEDLLRERRPEDANYNPARRLVEESVQNDGRDNTTAMVIQVS